QIALSLAEVDFKSIENILEHKLNDKIEIICYTDVSDLKQSNIGIDEVFISENNRTTVSGNRIFVYFDGDHTHLRKQIREGVGEVYLNAMIYGSGLSGFVQKSVQLKIPDWFREGLIAYLGDEWSVQADNQLRDLLQIVSTKKKFETLARDYPRLMGHAFWNYVTKEYGRSNVSNILYLARINRNIKSSFLYILGVPFDQIAKASMEYFRKNFQEDKKNLSQLHVQQALIVKNKKKLPVTTVRVSPDGNQFAYTVNNKGKYKVYVQKIRSSKPTKILSGGIKNNVQETDYSIPVFAWNQNNRDLALITEKHDTWWLYNIDAQSKKFTKDKLSPEYQRVYQVDWIDDKTLLLNASTDALSDLYTYLPITRESKRLTTDFYDDLNASYGTLMGQKGILFKSNRALDSLFAMPVDTLLPVQPFNLYFMPLDVTVNAPPKKLNRLTENKHYDLDQPSISGKNQVTYLDDETGVKQRKTITFDENGNIQEKLSTHGDHDILAYHAADQSGISVFQKGRNFLVIKDATNKVDSLDQHYTAYRQYQIKNQKFAKSDFIPQVQTKTNRPLPPVKPEEVSLFQSEYPDPPGTGISRVSIRAGEINTADSMLNGIEISDTLSSTSGEVVNSFHPERTEVPEKFRFTRMVASRLKFKLDHTVTTLDNELLFGGLNSYAGEKRGYEYPPAGFLVKAQIKDLFEDYIIEGGVRIPTNFNGTEYFLIVDDNKKRIDKRYGIYRQTRYLTEEVSSILAQRRRNRTSIAVAQWKYPFDTYQSFRLAATLRFDRSTILTTDPSNLNSEPTTAQRAGLKAEYVYDNTTPIDINRFTGTRAKGYIEVVKKMDIQIVDNWKLNLAKGFMTVMGFDARHYIGLDRKTILAFRLSGATSFGSEQILFYLGGVDNWLSPQYDEDTPIPGDKNYAYYALGANLRGFKQNIRNGASHVLFNSELRIPFIQYLVNHELRSVFLRNLQIVGFVDAGTAWFGTNPFDQKSPLNTTSVSNPKVKIDLIYARDPVVFGYGTGLRLTLMGYKVRADYAWGIETREVLKPKFYLSLGSDF
ncbi:MAG: BamA/TamA family outer membrane protein, partial [Saprospiraceae bacterium]